MRAKLLEILACPRCKGEVSCIIKEEDAAGEITTGSLHCASCKRDYPIEKGIPRFVPNDDYAFSFGLQWNRFRKEQLDSFNGTRLSADRLYSETGWNKEWLQGKWILDAGCGAGRFLDVVSQTDCDVVGIDLSNAVDAAQDSLTGRKNVHLVQASIYQLPFRPGVFDGCYCIGVIQHTPNPRKTLQCLPPTLKEGGRLAVTIYERKRWTPLYSKYLVRPITKRLDKQMLLRALQLLMPILFPLTEILFRLPYLGSLFAFALPIDNAVHEPQLSSLPLRYRSAIMNTFDMLAPEYDMPQTERSTRKTLATADIVEIQRLPNPGLNLIGRKGSAATA
ncbi:MAG: methyltransferase domain-containing protein [Abitibacteriaceae bacterium]|nr:methyltransferase domain-containing protein [Abditibacteriaceae bacterium]